MKSLIGSDEAKLVLALMSKKKEVPEDLKAKALEQLRVFSMACETGTAKSYLIDNLIEAIEADDIDRVKEIGLLSAACLDDKDDSEDVFNTPEAEAAAKSAIDDFIADMRSKGLPGGAIEAILKKAMSEFLFIPLMYKDEMLAGFSDKHNCILIFGIGFDGDRSELIDRYGTIDQRLDMIRIVAKEFEVKDNVEVHFLAVQYNLLNEHDMELVIRGLE